MKKYLEIIGMNGRYRPRTIPCEICDSRRFSLLQSKGRVGGPGVYGPLPVRVCGRCGFVMINPRYERRFYIDYYRKTYRHVATGRSAPTAEYLRRQTHRGEQILRFIEKAASSAGKMLDIGCSAGATMVPFLKAGWRCAGVDPDVGSVKTGRGLRLPVRIGDAENLPFRKGEFSLAVSLGTFEHVYDFSRAMRRCRFVLEEGGLLLMRTRSHAMWGSPLEYYNHNHYRYFSNRTLKLALLRFGFKPIRFTSEPLEGIPGAYYTLARAARPLSRAELLDAIDGGTRDSAADLSHRLRTYERRFEDKARGFLSLVEACSGDTGRILKTIRKEKNPFTILDGPPEEAVQRAEMEARRFLAAAAKMN